MTSLELSGYFFLCLKMKTFPLLRYKKSNRHKLLGVISNNWDYKLCIEQVIVHLNLLLKSQI